MTTRAVKSSSKVNRSKKMSKKYRSKKNSKTKTNNLKKNSLKYKSKVSRRISKIKGGSKRKSRHTKVTKSKKLRGGNPFQPKTMDELQTGINSSTTLHELFEKVNSQETTNLIRNLKPPGEHSAKLQDARRVIKLYIDQKKNPKEIKDSELEDWFSIRTQIKKLPAIAGAAAVSSQAKPGAAASSVDFRTLNPAPQLRAAVSPAQSPKK